MVRGILKLSNQITLDGKKAKNFTMQNKVLRFSAPYAFSSV
jgi:hypothetical protein